MNLSEILKKATKGDSVYNTLLATVKAVDEAARTCDVLPIDGSAEIFGVRLNALLEVDGDDNPIQDVGEYNIPAVNSFVLVTLLDSANAFVSGFSVIDKKIGTIGKVVYTIDQDKGVNLKVDTNKAVLVIDNEGDIKINSARDIIFNNGSNGGMVLNSPLNNYLQNIKLLLDELVSKYNAHIHPAGTPNTAPTLSVVASTNPSVPAMENSKVKH
jgi:hypothetical protein